MHMIARAAALCAVVATAAGAQQPDSARSKARADSIEKARQDSIALVREMEKALAQPTTPSAPAAAPGQGGPTNPRLLPDISAVGDFIADLSPKGSTQEDATRFGVREVELAVQAAVDPYFRGDIFLGINDVEGLAIEQAYLTATALPYQIEARLGRFLMPFGKQNTTHRHDLHTIEYPWVVQRFFGPEGLKGTGVYVSRVFSPFGFYQELQATAVDRFGEGPEDARLAEPINKELGGLAYSARLRNYWDISEAANIELSASGITGRVEHPVGYQPPNSFIDYFGPPAYLSTPINAVSARQTVAGIDFTFRWRPLQQGLYHSFILQAEVMRQFLGSAGNTPSCADLELSPTQCAYTFDAGPSRGSSGGYALARIQVSQRAYLGARGDLVEEAFGGTTKAGSGYLEWFPSEFSKLVAAYERYMPPGERGVNRILLQASFALGPHKPHPF